MRALRLSFSRLSVMGSLATVLLLALVSGCTADPADLFAPGGSVAGAVRDADTGQTIAGVSLSAWLWLGDMSNSEWHYCTSGSNGEYEFDGLRQRTYHISASYAGYYSYQADVSIAAGDVLIHDIDLTPVDRLREAPN